MRLTHCFFNAVVGLALLSSAALSLNGQTVTITPGYTSIGVNATLQYSAVVTGLTNTSVTWSVSGTPAKSGKITATGLYTAPAAVPSNGVTINALASDKKTSSTVYVNVAPAGPSIAATSPASVPIGTYNLTIIGTGFKSGANVQGGGANLPTTFVNSTTLKVNGYQGSAGSVPFQVENPGSLWGAPFFVTFQGASTQTISPTTASVSLGATKQFTSAGATSWMATAGSVSPSGLYTAPGTMPASNKVTVTATGPHGSASAAVTLVNATQQTISPSTASLNPGTTLQFTSAGATAWTATAGSISNSGLYTAPAMYVAGVITISATGPNGSASATVTLINVTQQTISPTTASLNPGATQQFTSAGATAWTATAGSISSSGLYTAPATYVAGAITVTATGPNGSASSSVTLIPPAPSILSVGNGSLPLGIFSSTITGTGFTSQSIAQLNGAPLTTKYSGGTLAISGFYGQSGVANITVSNGSSVSSPFPVQVGVQNALASAAAARRFLEQGAFGPTPTDAARVQTLGEAGWISEQFALPQISNYNSVTGEQGGMPTHFLTMAVSNQDQLRQRVAFALSQIFVTSLNKLIWNDNMVTLQNTLLGDAFSNYRQIMADVTLSPAMGQYLDMANNAKADPVSGSLANENYARELMQLFTTGTNLLNQDGSLQLDSHGMPMAVYSQFTITEFARVYTGWTYAPAPGQPVQWGAYISSNGNMVPYAAEHDTGSKQLLNGYVSPIGATPQQDLNNALDNIFNHPNVGPFVGTQLIQHLVKGNPSPGYVSRVAAAFNDSGHGVRGDMQATIAAVLLDPEARANDEGGKDLSADGHLQEPALFIPAMVRAFGGQMNDQNYYASELAELGEDLFDPPSVFNYYSPGYVVPGTALMGGEFQIHSPNNAIVRANEVANLMFSQYSNPVQSYGPGTTVDLTPFVALAATPSTLVDALDLTLSHGVMPAAMKAQVVAAVNADKGSGSVHQVQTACYLILSSTYYNVWH